MKALILAAGLGTRLKPLTNSTPKALLKAGQFTLLEFAIKKVAFHGFTDITVNVHHFAEQILEYLSENRNFGFKINISDESDKLLDTGGALKKARPFLEGTEPFLVYNADIISSINLTLLFEYHLRYSWIATLAVRRRETTRYLLFDELMQLTEWQNKEKGLRKIIKLTEKPPQPFAFSGIHIIDPAIFSLLPDQQVFSIIDAYLEIAKKQPIRGFVDESPVFIDAGKPQNLKEAAHIITPDLF
ncbi:MAG TPA: nucleotidyltransferase family protein [Lentimicrobium sp.]|nr:nucleotidyltransferase family protein [Lentimicrobium sp.]